MKTYKTILFALIIICYSCALSKKVELNKQLGFKLPKNAKQINKDNLNEVPHGLSTYEKALFPAMDKVYEIDDIVMGFRLQTWTKENESHRITLENELPQFSGALGMGGYTISHAAIQNIGNNRFLIYNYTKNDGTSYYHFFSDLGKNTNNMDGFVRYDTSKQQEAEKLLNSMLMSFKTK